MTWIVHETKIAQHFEWLRSETGAFIGYILQFNPHDTVYACDAHKTIGRFAAGAFGEAKDAVEGLVP